jgi:hypothetical protein
MAFITETYFYRSEQRLISDKERNQWQYEFAEMFPALFKVERIHAPGEITPYTIGMKDINISSIFQPRFRKVLKRFLSFFIKLEVIEQSEQLWKMVGPFLLEEEKPQSVTIYAVTYFNPSQNVLDRLFDPESNPTLHEGRYVEIFRVR